MEMPTRRRKKANPVPATTETLLEGLNPEQQEVVTHKDGPALVVAVAGAGKTRALVHRIAYLIAFHAVKAAAILAVTFSKKAADEMNERLAALGVNDARVGTWHSVAWEICRAERSEFRDWEIDSKDRFKTLVKIVLGYQHMNWQGADLGIVLSYIGRCKAFLAEPGTKEAQAIADEVFAGNPCGQTNPGRLMQAYALAQDEAESRHLMTFDDMLVECWKILRDDESARVRWSSKWGYVLQDEAQDQNHAQITIGEMLARDHKNYMLVGDPAQCHPPGVKVQIEKGVEVSIETLANGQRIDGWNRNAQKMVGGRKIEIAERHYDGKLFTVEVSDRAVPMTANHKVLARWTDRMADHCVTYLMYRRDLGYRVGWCKLFAQGGEGNSGFHLAQRARIEKADAVWILGVHTSRTEASVDESVIAAGYGLPTATFEPVHGAKHQTKESIERIFSDSLVKARNEESAIKCLQDRRLDPSLPVYPFPETEHGKVSRGTYFPVYAVNVLPGLMSLPLPDARNVWAPVESVAITNYNGPVYSLDVEIDHAYAANGVVVLNSIYGFRGAVPEKLLAFEKDWGAKVIRMHRNYRCGDQVVNAANGSIRAMDPKTHLGVELTGERKSDANVTVVEYADPDAEGAEVAQRISEYAADGVDWGDMVVLYRTNAQSRGVEEACLSNRIPYVVLGGTNFYERKEVKDLLAYVRVAAGRGKFDDVRRCINAPFRFLGRAFVDKIEEAGDLQPGDTDWIKAVNDASQMARVQRRQQASVSEWVGMIEGLAESIRQSRQAREESEIPNVVRENHGPAACLERVIKETDYMRYLTRDEGAETAENNRVSNVRELVRAAERFDTVDALLDYIDDTLAAAKEAKANDKGNRVILCSLHRSKGLEWPVVFVIGCNEGILPHRKAVEAGHEGEERRLFYVGVTRAKDNLHLSHVTTAALGDKVVPMYPSKFLGEAGL